MSLLAMPSSGEHHDLAFAPGQRDRRGGVEESRGDGAFAGGGQRDRPARRRRRGPLVAVPAEGLGRARRGLGRQQHGAQGLEVVGCAGQLPGVAGPSGGAMAGPGGNQLRVARAGQLAQPGGGVLPAGAHQVVQQPRLDGPVPGRRRLRGGVPQLLRRLGGPPRCHGGPRVGELLLGSAEAERRPGGTLGQRLGGGASASASMASARARPERATRRGPAKWLA